MQEKDFDRLVTKYLDGSATELEKELVEAHVRLFGQDCVGEMNPYFSNTSFTYSLFSLDTGIFVPSVSRSSEIVSSFKRLLI